MNKVCAYLFFPALVSVPLWFLKVSDFSYFAGRVPEALKKTSNGKYWYWDGAWTLTVHPPSDKDADDDVLGYVVVSLYYRVPGKPRCLYDLSMHSTDSDQRSYSSLSQVLMMSSDSFLS